MALTILGATGTIGQNCLSLVRQQPQLYHVVGLSAHHNLTELWNLVRQFQPRALAVTGYDLTDQPLIDFQQLCKTQLPPNQPPCQLFAGAGAACELVHWVADYTKTQTYAYEKNFLLLGMVGFSALKPLMTALNHQLLVGLANKESIVSAGHLLQPYIHSGQIIPIDSEHNAITQCLLGQDKKSVKKIILTASGGPFWQWAITDFANITPEQALRHPRWQMGKKISIDSATMVNKGLEIIEAHYLFSHLWPPQTKPAEKIEVLIHPEAFMHALVEFVDGSCIAQLGPPDMRLPIAFALGYPDRLPITAANASHAIGHLTELAKLQFVEPDTEKFPALHLARQALGYGAAGAIIYNACNEMLVEAFLAKQIPFTAIARGLASMLEKLTATAVPPNDLTAVVALDAMVRQKTQQQLITDS